MIRLLLLVCLTWALPSIGNASAADLIAFRRHADDKSENSGRISGVAFSPDGKLVAAGFGTFAGMLGEPRPGPVVLWNVQTGQPHATLWGHVDGVRSVAFSPNGKLIATAEFMTQIKLWETEAAKEIASIRVTGVIGSIAFSPDSQFLVAGLDALGVESAENNAELYDVATKKLVRRFEGHEWGISTVAFSPSGKLLATSSNDGTARIWDVATGKSITTLRDSKLEGVYEEFWQRVDKRKAPVSTKIQSVAFSSDEERLAIAGGTTGVLGREYGIGAVTVWDVSTFQLLGTLPDCGCDLEEVEFSPNGKLLVSAGRDGYVRLWDAANLLPMGRFPGRAPVAFSPDGKALISTTREPSLELRQIAEVTAKGSLSATEEETRQTLSGLEQLWSVGHDYLYENYDAYLCPAYDARTKSIFGLHSGQCDVLGLDGKVRRSFPVARGVKTLRLAKLSDAESSEFAGFQNVLSKDAIMFNDAGKILWQQSEDASNVKDVWPADVDGDGWDEVIVVDDREDGGLRVFDHAGNQRWKNSEMTDVSCITAGDVLGDKKPEVIALSDGIIHCFDADGKVLKQCDVAFSPQVVGVVRVAADTAFSTIVVAGSDDSGNLISAVDGDGNAIWAQRLNGLETVESIAVCPTRPWVAVAASGIYQKSAVVVIDCRDGRIIAEANDLGTGLQTAWATADNGDTPLLLTASVRALSAFQVIPPHPNPALEKVK